MPFKALPYMQTYNWSGFYLGINGGGWGDSDEDSGPGYDSLISAFTIVSSGTYSVRVGARSSTGPYVVRVEVGRTVQLESDGDFSNDSISGANSLRKVADGVQAKASIAGTIMQTGRPALPDAGNTDEDTFDLGRLNAGNIVEINFRFPSGSTLAPRVTLLNSAGSTVVDEDGNATNGHFRATLPAAGSYYARVEANSGAGSSAQYILDVTIDDNVAPKVTAVGRFPANGGSTDRVISTFTVSFDESLSASAVNAGTPLSNWDLREAGTDGNFLRPGVTAENFYRTGCAHHKRA